MKRTCSIFLIFACVLAFFSGCGGKDEVDLSGDGGFRGETGISEGEDNVLISARGGGLGYLDKETEQFTYLCKNPACKHEHGSCISGHFPSQIRRAGKGFCFFDVPNATFYLLDSKNKVTELYQVPQHQAGDAGLTSPALIYNNRVCYTDRAEEKGNSFFVLTDLATKETKTIPVQYLIASFIPFENYFYFITSEMELCRIKMDGGAEEKLSGDKEKISNIQISGSKIYYINRDINTAGLYRMEPDGTEKEQLYENEVDSLAVEGEDIYFAVNTDGGHATYRMKTDKTGLTKILNQTAYVYPFAAWDRVLCINADDTYILMDRDGSHQKELTIYRLNV